MVLVTFPERKVTRQRGETRTPNNEAHQYNLTVFNIGGNKIRLIAAVHFNTQCLYIRHVLTHKEYDKEKWKKS